MGVSELRSFPLLWLWESLSSETYRPQDFAFWEVLEERILEEKLRPFPLFSLFSLDIGFALTVARFQFKAVLPLFSILLHLFSSHKICRGHLVMVRDVVQPVNGFLYSVQLLLLVLTKSPSFSDPQVSQVVFPQNLQVFLQVFQAAVGI